MAERGVFVVIEGPDGAGKTTQARRLVDELSRRGLDPLLVREPGGTGLGEKIRAILLDPANDPMDARAELFLYMASRAQLAREVLAPALSRGRVVVADRFLASSAVYQGIAGGLGMAEVLAIGRVAVSGCEPDLTIVLDLAADRAAERVARTRARDRIEGRGLAYHTRVCEGYRAFARAAGAPGVRLVDADRDEGAVFADVLEAALPALERGPRPAGCRTSGGA